MRRWRGLIVGTFRRDAADGDDAAAPSGPEEQGIADAAARLKAAIDEGGDTKAATRSLLDSLPESYRYGKATKPQPEGRGDAQLF
jgi:hypothetical protein